MDKQLFRLDVLGQSLTVQSREDPAWFAEVSGFLKSRLEEVQRETRLAEPLKVALLTALNLVDELLKLHGGTVVPAGESREIEEITRRMITSIDESLRESESRGSEVRAEPADPTPRPWLPAGGRRNS